VFFLCFLSFRTLSVCGGWGAARAVSGCSAGGVEASAASASAASAAPQG